MIKRVVDVSNKQKTITVKKFPEFDDNKIYVTDCNGSGLYRIFKDNLNLEVTFRLYPLNCSSTQSKTYIGEDGFRQICIIGKRVTYILDNMNQFADFLKGERNFPIVEEVTETTQEVSTLADDEVSINDCDPDKIYAMNNSVGIAKLTSCSQNSNNETRLYQWNYMHNSGYTEGSPEIFKEKIIRYKFKVYQFDTQEEFLTWALEQTTNKDKNIVVADAPKINEVALEKAFEKLISFAKERLSCNEG
jgi:hypothetical protein